MDSFPTVVVICVLLSGFFLLFRAITKEAIRDHYTRQEMIRCMNCALELSVQLGDAGDLAGERTARACALKIEQEYK